MEKINILADYDVESWLAPAVTADIPHGDMPGDKVEIDESHIEKARVIFPELLKKLQAIAKAGKDRAVVTVCGGSGVGKSEIASLLSYFFSSMGIGSYTLSGDNYPRRIPMYNDAERLRLFRDGGLRQMIKDEVYTEKRFNIIHEYQLAGNDADIEIVKDHPWYASYIDGGVNALKGYLGTKNESDFDQVSDIISHFKAGDDTLWLKRMGRTDTELWYEEVDMKETGVIIIEWTHGNSDEYTGVDVPVFLNSTPEETLAHRKARNRDGKTDSPFTMRVLEIEQELLRSQAHKAKIIVAKSGKLISFEEV